MNIEDTPRCSGSSTSNVLRCGSPRRPRTAAPCLALVLLVVAALTGCSSSKTSPLIEGTTVVGIPPVPVDLAPELYVADTRLADDCRNVAGGIQNCEAILKRKASNELIGVVSREVSREVEDRETREIGGEGGGYAVDAVFVDRVTARYLAQAQLRELPSPLFHLEEERAFVMRTVLVREEADFNIWGDLLQRAKAESRSSVAKAVQQLIKDKYRDKGPKRSDIEKVEKRVAEHYQTMWDRATSKKR